MTRQCDRFDRRETFSIDESLLDGWNEAASPSDSVVGRGCLGTPAMLVEILDSCNLQCPSCISDKPAGGWGQTLQYHSLASLKNRIVTALQQVPGIDTLELGGGEATLHPDLFPLLDWILGSSGIRQIALRTNGLRLGRDPGLSRQLACRSETGRLVVHLQYDGTQSSAHLHLRGADLREIKHTAMERCDGAGLPFFLVCTVCEGNLEDLWETVNLGRRFDSCLGVIFQSVGPKGRGGRVTFPVELAAIREALVCRSEGALSADMWSRIECQHSGMEELALLGSRGRPMDKRDFALRIRGASVCANAPDVRQSHAGPWVIAEDGLVVPPASYFDFAHGGCQE
ncbi:putative radical SAM superfamily Fe-S cluster-containing enzyme [Haloferula luteola]|uniref:Putative radical SAM superfamily Fe-S cluster-containing enzyme n=1 Tax=Haloferula luteola TaxID=595692 RepID=A0A840UYP1_9BACT|nr:hypothetical protein [Haloferula luteola]MBB5351257.1 putative radical SAM superfamily Fe-S cluster-containing enzyme [Haloferula luteola]